MKSQVEMTNESCDADHLLNRALSQFTGLEPEDGFADKVIGAIRHHKALRDEETRLPVWIFGQAFRAWTYSFGGIVSGALAGICIALVTAGETHHRPPPPAHPMPAIAAPGTLTGALAAFMTGGGS